MGSYYKLRREVGKPRSPLAASRVLALSRKRLKRRLLLSSIAELSFDEKAAIDRLFRFLAVEGITSPDGRVLGKMAHTERFSADDIFKNIDGNKLQPIFTSGVNYFK